MSSTIVIPSPGTRKEYRFILFDDDGNVIGTDLFVVDNAADLLNAIGEFTESNGIAYDGGRLEISEIITTIRIG